MDQKWPPDQEFETPDLVGVNSKLDHIKSIKNSEIKLREFVYIINVCLFMKCPFLRGTRECLWGQRKKKTVKQLWTFQLLQTVRNEAETKEEAYTSPSASALGVAWRAVWNQSQGLYYCGSGMRRGQGRWLSEDRDAGSQSKASRNYLPSINEDRRQWDLTPRSCRAKEVPG